MTDPTKFFIKENNGDYIIEIEEHGNRTEIDHIDLQPGQLFQFENEATHDLKIKLPKFTVDPAGKHKRTARVDVGETSDIFTVESIFDFIIEKSGGPVIKPARTIRININ